MVFCFLQGAGEGDVGVDYGAEGLLGGGDGWVGGVRVVEEGCLQGLVLEEGVQVAGILLFQ